MKKEKIAVAYSGGLDTSVMIKWLMDRFDAEIITVTGNLGQRAELAGLHQKAYKTGAKKVFIKDLRKEFVYGYIYPALKAGALYEQAYPLATALGRPLLAKTLVEVARMERATMVAHGCTGKGNDQVRFEVAFSALAPELKVVAPLRMWEFKSREEEIEYARRHNIPVSATASKPYSIDENLWGTAIECGVLEDPMVEPPLDAYQHTVSPEEAPDRARTVAIEFEEGIPVGLDGHTVNGVELIQRLNEIGGKNAVGRIDLVENRLVGIKSREIYEAPAACILHFAHTELERLTLDKSVFHYKQHVAQEYSDLIYNGLWFSPLKDALDAFVDETQTRVSGLVKVKLYKGSITVTGRTSSFSLYDSNLATYTDGDQFEHDASEGFIKIYGLPLKTFHRVTRDGTRKVGKRIIKRLKKGMKTKRIP
jgi:argininosuccinate synthase